MTIIINNNNNNSPFKKLKSSKICFLIFLPNINIQSKNNILWKFEGQKISGSAINRLLSNNGHFKFFRFHNKINKYGVLCFINVITFFRNILVLFLRRINKQIIADISVIFYLNKYSPYS